MVGKREVVARGSLSVFLGKQRVRVGEVDLVVASKSFVRSPDLYGEVHLNDNFFRFVKRSSHVYIGVWASPDSVSSPTDSVPSSEVCSAVEPAPAV
jgi:hypothetical protein